MFIQTASKPLKFSEAACAIGTFQTPYLVIDGLNMAKLRL